MKVPSSLKVSALISSLALIGCGQEAAPQQQAKEKEPELSDSAKLVRTFLNAKPAQSKIFCGEYISWKYNNSTAMGDQNVINDAKYYKYLEEQGYITKMKDTWTPQGLAGLSSIAGEVEYRFKPTEKFLDLMDDHDANGCYLANSFPNQNVVITSEIVHPQYKQVSTVYARYDRKLSRLWEIWNPMHGYPGSGAWMARVLMIENPVTRAHNIKRMDVGVLSGQWATERVPQAMAIINTAGPDAIQ
jgi:hypothetical protein